MKRAIKYIIQGRYPDFVRYPPNCIEFVQLCKACVTISRSGQRYLAGPKPGRHWADVEIERRVQKLKNNPEWDKFLKEAKNCPNTLELIKEWSGIDEFT